VLATITFAVFGQTMGFGFVNYDDNKYVYANAKVAGGLSWEGLGWIFTHADCDLYHPLTMLSLMADYQFHGLDAGWYHRTNVLLHTASVILLFLILRQMTGALWRSAFVAAVFAVHPLRVESVAWVAERKDVLSGFFFMLTLGAYVHYIRKPNSLGRYLMVAAAFLLALLSKPTVVTLPFVLLLLDYWPLQRVELVRRLILEKIPLLALAAAACAMTVLAAEKELATRGHVSMASRLGNAVVSYAGYLRQMVWPEGLAVPYPQPEKGYPVWTIAGSFLLLALITGSVLTFRRKRRWLLAGWLWYLGMLTPMIGIFQMGTFAHADRMTYLPQIGLYLLVTWTVADLSAGWYYRRAALGGLAAIILGALIFCARIQTAYWRDSETLWTRALACTTGNDVAHYNLGNALRQKGRIGEAITQYQATLQIEPDYAPAHVNLGNIFLQTGNVNEAITHYQSVLQIEPSSAKIHNNLGTALRRAGRVDEAIAHYQKALKITPNDESIHFNLAKALLQRGRVEEAITHYQEALKIEPADLEIQNNLAWLLATSAQAPLRNGEKATQLARQANEQAGGKDPVILGTLAAACAETGQFDDAVQSAEKAIGLAQAAGRQDLARRLNDELRRYRAGLPLHQ
jgi:tetratricopeptide (TPR) repeat protein